MASVFKRGGKKAKGQYYASWFDHNGKRRTKCTGTTDKATAERIARKYEADAALRREGVIDPTMDAVSKEAQRSIESHLVDFRAKMEAAGREIDHVNSTISYVRLIAESANFTVVADITADGVNHYANYLQGKGRSLRTVQAYLVAMKAFTKWLTEEHKLPRDPLASVKKPDPRDDRRRERRMLLHQEWHWLRTATAQSSEDRYGMEPNERVLLYATAIQTGLRSNELRSLSRTNLPG